MAIPTTQKECTTRRIAALIIGLWDKIKNAFLLKTSRGAANGVASLDANGKVPSSQLPTVPTGNLPSNSSSSAGIVASGSGQDRKVWMTDSNGNPSWREIEFHPNVTYGYSLLGTFNLHGKGLLELQISCSRDVQNGITINACVGVAQTWIGAYYTPIARTREISNIYKLAYKLASNDDPSGNRIIEIWLIDTSQSGQSTRRCSVRVTNSSGDITYTEGSQTTQTLPSNLIDFSNSVTDTICSSLYGENGGRTCRTWSPQRGGDNPFVCRSGFYTSLLSINSGNTVAAGKWIDINLSSGTSLNNGGMMLYISTFSSNNPACYVLECSAFSYGSARLTVRGDLYNGYAGHINNFYIYVSNGMLHLFFKVESICTIKIASDGDLDINKVTVSNTAPADTSNPLPTTYISSTVPSYYYNKRYSYANGQVGSDNTPVYVNSNGELVACTNIPVIEHVTTIPVSPTVGTIYAL